MTSAQLDAIQNRLDKGMSSSVDAHDLMQEVRRLTLAVDAERAAVLDYLDFRMEMSYYNDAIREMRSIRGVVGRGEHLNRPFPDEPPDADDLGNDEEAHGGT